MNHHNDTLAALDHSETKAKEDDSTGNIIRITRQIIKNMDEGQRFQKAKAHILDALNSRYPRPQTESLETSGTFRFLYGISTWSPWEWLLFLLGYTFMYLVVLDQQHFSAKVGLQGTILTLFWTETALSYYIKQSNTLGKDKISTSLTFKASLLALMTIDLILFITLPGEAGERPLRPFRILRCFIPMLYDSEMRKTFFSLVSAYTDVLVYLIFFSIVVGAWALVGSRSLTFDPAFVDASPQFSQHVDPYKNDYSNLSHMVFIVYVAATYDSYPDNELLAIQNFQPNYIFFIVFIFMNMFLFSSIPGSLIYCKFRQTRSKIILIDQIRQQHSLIIAFVTLAEDSPNLPTQKLIKFLNFIYRYKIRYIEYITDICLKLDDNNNRSIQVNEFMQLSKIILENKAMTPPAFDDLQCWLRLRKMLQEKFKLKAMVQHWIFQVAVTVIILSSFANALFYIFDPSQLVQVLDIVFVWVFVLELLLRIVGVGPENFFADRWNNVDTFLVVLGVLFFFLQTDVNIGTIARMGRIFRLASLFRIISHSSFMKNFHLRAFDKLTKIFSVILEIIPIILKFMPLFLFFFYIFAIAGMELFYDSYPIEGDNGYSMYRQYSSFRTFIQAHYLMMQVLTEAGWSMIAFDHSWKNPQYYGYVMGYFCFMHIIIVYIIATLIKGIFWQVFLTVDKIFEERDRTVAEQTRKEQANQSKIKEIKKIQSLIESRQELNPKTIIQRQLFQNKLDSDIFKMLKNDENINRHNRRSSKNNPLTSKQIILSKVIENCEISIEDLEISEGLRSKIFKHSVGGNREESSQSESSRSKISLDQIEEVDEEDFQSEIDDLFHHVIINQKARFSHIIGQNKIFKEYLAAKLVKPEALIKQTSFDLTRSPLHNKESMLLHIYEIHSLLGIETSKRQQKAAIIQNLRKDDFIDEQQAESLVKKRLQEKVFNIDTNGTLRKLFLSETNEDLIRKFQVQYFSDLYGHSFKQINKLTLQPLLKVEATLTYSLRNILRYPQIDNIQFFQMFTHIEDLFSNKVLQKGSIFKFIYKLDCFEQIWFSIEYKRQQDMRVHFIKTGVWCYDKEMQDNQVYYARDVFNCSNAGQSHDTSICQKLIKRFYQSFEGLAFSLLDEQKFFQATPKKYVYDLYLQCFQASTITRFISRQHEISKIMVVVLSKEEERRDIGQPELQYSLSDLLLPQSLRPSWQFTFQDSDNDTYQKLKNLTALDHQKIVQNQGLPFSYIVNLMKELSDILSLYSSNFIYQIQKVYNTQFQLMNTHQSGQSDPENPKREDGGLQLERQPFC